MLTGKHFIGTVLVVVLAGTSPPILAQRVDSGWYMGAAVGRADYKLPAGIVHHSDTGDSSAQVLVGYRVNRHVAVEGGYADFGTARRVLGWPPGIYGICDAGTISTCNGDVRETTTATAYKLAAVGTIPITDRIDVFGKLGIASVTVTRVISQYVSESSRDTRTRPSYGVGVRYNLIPGIGLRLEWERFNSSFSTSPTSQVDVQVYSVGVEFQF